MNNLPDFQQIVAEQTGVTGTAQIVRSPEELLGLQSKKAVSDVVIYGNDSKSGDSRETAKVLTRTKEYTDEDGNTCYETEMYKKCYSHGKMWAKIWLMDVLQALGMISNSKQMDVVFYILENTKLSENLFIGTIRSIHEETKISTRTINVAIQKMVGANMIKKQQAGVYKVNPAFLLQGNDGKKRRLTIEYEAIDKEADLEEMIEAET